MITFIQGRLSEKQPARAVVNVGGVGYEIFIPVSTYDKLPATGENCTILTHDHVREDSHQLFGFATESERGAFLMLTGVSGIGPKLAMSVLSGLSVRDLKAAVVTGDIERLTSISGVGRKTAERIVVELKHRMSDADFLEASAGVSGKDDGRAGDAVRALMALGYRQADAGRMTIEVLKKDKKGSLSVEDIVKRVLKGNAG